MIENIIDEGAKDVAKNAMEFLAEKVAKEIYNEVAFNKHRDIIVEICKQLVEMKQKDLNDLSDSISELNHLIS